MPLAGNLRDMALPDLIQITCQERKRARLKLRRDNEEAEIYFDGGEMVHAKLGELTGQEVIYHLLGWHDGEFALESDVEPPERTIDVHWAALLMDGLRAYDESTSESLGEEVFEVPKKTGLREILAELGQEVSGFMAAVVVGLDGLEIAAYSASPDVDVENISAQMTMFMRLVETTIAKMKMMGTVEDDLLSTEKAFLLIRKLDDGNHYLGIAAERDKVRLGNLRLHSRIFAKRLSEAIPK